MLQMSVSMASGHKVNMKSTCVLKITVDMYLKDAGPVLETEYSFLHQLFGKYAQLHVSWQNHKN